MDKSTLVKLIGFPATLIHGDTLVLDRWKWLEKQLPKVYPPGSKKLLDVGCGTGAFTIGAALRGYDSLGLSWDERNQATARNRAELCHAPLATFEVLDVRLLDQRTDLLGQYDVIVCCENIEHILNDKKLVFDMAQCLKPGGTLLLTTPNLAYRPMTKNDTGPFLPIEDGGHVRKGYDPGTLTEICRPAGLNPTAISFCSGFFSQKLTGFMRFASQIHPMIGWAITLPFRPFIHPLDQFLNSPLGWPGYSITLTASKELPK